MIDRKRQRLEKRIESLEEEVDVLNNQLDKEMDESHQLRIKRRIKDLKTELEEVYGELEKIGGGEQKSTQQNTPNTTPTPLKLDGKQRKQFHQALIEAFPNEKRLARMVDFQLGENLTDIAGSGHLGDVIFDLIKWADSRGKTAELITGAIEENPDSPILQIFAKQFNKEFTNES